MALNAFESVVESWYCELPGVYHEDTMYCTLVMWVAAAQVALFAVQAAV